MVEEADNLQHDPEECDACKKHGKHKEKYTQTRIEYQVASFTADMQKVIVLPKLTTKEHVFVSRLVAFNETFAARSPDYPDYCILWHEAVAGRKAPNVASSYFKVLKECQSLPQAADHFEFWADNCSGQNKNWWLLTSHVQCVNTWGPKSIKLKFLEKGHTFMAADSVYCAIGRKFKKSPVIETFEDFFAICDTATTTTKAVILDLPNFLNITKKIRTRSIEHHIPLLESLVEMKFLKGKKNMFVKTSFNQYLYKEIDFLQPKFVKTNKWKSFPEAVTERRGIASKKKNGIIGILKGVTMEKKAMWMEMYVNEAVPGLATGRDEGEEE